MISPSFDKRPVYINRFGLPIRQGSQLRYYVIGTNTPKTVYSDAACTVPAAWPQIINAESRTDTQIFVGVGDATVLSYEIKEGVDPNTAVFDDDYDLDNQWAEAGLAAVSGTNTTSVVQLSTIASLRATNPTGSGVVEYEVQGYYAQGDKPPVRYYWDAASVSTDNGGTIIQASGISPGRYILRMEGPVYDVRNSGIIPGKTDLSVNGLMSSLQASMTYGSKIPTTIYFPPGIYRIDPGSMTWTSPVMLDQWATFNVASAGTFTMVFSNTWDIKAKYGLQDSSSTGSLVLSFSYKDSSIPVNLRWWGAAYTGAYTAGEGDALRSAAAATDKTHPIIIDEPYLVDSSLGGSFTVPNPVIFQHDGIIKNDQLGHTFKLSTIVNARTDDGACLDFTGAGSLSIVGGYPIKTSWFGQAAGYDAAPGLIELNITCQKGTRVEMDKDLYITNTVTTFADTAFQHLTWVPQGGVLIVDGDHSTIHIGYIDYTENRVFTADPAAIAVDSGVVTPMMWYDRSSNADEAFRAALWATLAGRFDTTLDLAGRSWATTNQVGSDNSYNKSRTIRNGLVTSTMAYPVIDVSSGITFRISTDKVTYNGVSPWLKVESGASLANAYFRDAAITCTGSIAVVPVGALYNLHATGSALSGASILNGNLWSSLHLTDCTLTGSITTQSPTIKVKGCSVWSYGSTTTNWYLRGPATNVVGNEFNGVSVGIMPYNTYGTNIITGNITGNTFNITNDTYGVSTVYANADTTDTVINGFVVVGNTWYCAELAAGAQILTIMAITTGAGTYRAGGSYHQCKVTSNSGIESNTMRGNSRILVPSTVLHSTWTAPYVSGGIPGPITVALPPTAFTIPNVSTECVGIANGMVASGGSEYMALDCVSGASYGNMTIRLSGEVSSGAGSNVGTIAAGYTLFGYGG